MCAKVIEYSEPKTLDCDKPGCGYEEPIAGPISEDMIDTPCPKCGESLLTQEDYNDTLEIINVMKDYANVMNNLSKEELDKIHVGVTIPRGVETANWTSIGVKSHKGNINFNVQRVKNDN